MIETHVVVTGLGQDKGALVGLVETNSKRDAIEVAEKEFRKQHKIGTNIHLDSRIVFSGDTDEARNYKDRLMALLDEHREAKQ